MRALLSLVVLGGSGLLLIGGSAASLGCSGGGEGGGGGGGSGAGGGSGGGGGAQNQGVSVLDPTATERLPLAMAIGPNDRVGVAYFVKIGLSTTRSVPVNDAGFDPGGASDYDLRYVEWQGGNVSTPQKVTTVQRVFGISLTFNGGGEPVVSYLGGGDDQSIYWFQSDAVVSVRTGGNTWTESPVALRGDEVPCGNPTCAPVSDRGLLVGLTPAVVYANNQLFVAWRDGHDGQFPQQDWAGSDLEAARGSPGAWTRQMVAAGGGDKKAWGGHAQMVVGAGNLPAMVSDHVYGSADGFGTGVFFHRFNGTAWTTSTLVAEAQATNNQTGPSLAWRAQSGYGVAFINRSTDTLKFMSSMDGNTWTVANDVFGNGTGGWYPSLGFDPVTDQPAIAFYICSKQPGATEGLCPEQDDALVLVTRNPVGDWPAEQVIDTNGGYMPKLGFLSDNKRVIAYRDPRTYAVKLYVDP